MLPCNGCAYRESIPGDAHSRCVFDWSQALKDVPPDPAPRVRQWFRFPFNYDPVWGPDTCAQRSETRDPKKIAKPNPLADILSLLR
jgi:hypothetical protein